MIGSVKGWVSVSVQWVLGIMQCAVVDREETRGLLRHFLHPNNNDLDFLTFKDKLNSLQNSLHATNIFCIAPLLVSRYHLHKTNMPEKGLKFGLKLT